MMSNHSDKQQTDLNPQSSAEEFRLMVDSIQDYAIFRLDPEGRVASWNLGAERIEGYTAEEIVGQHFSTFYTPDNIAQGRPERALEIARQEGRYEEEDIHLRKDGSQFWARLHITPLYEAKGLRGFSGIIRDITERKKLEIQLAKQAAELATVAEISATVSTILDPQLMLQTVVDLTKARFGLYHAHIYLLNEMTGVLALVAGAGEVGRQMVAEGRTIALDQGQSLVARAAQTRQGIIVNNVRLDPGFLSHPLLPETLSEMAVPIIIGDKVLGVLDVQSEEAGHFTMDDVRPETTLAAQVAVALQNARSFEQAEKTLNDFNVVARRLTHEGWDQYLEATPAELAYLYDLQQVVPFQPNTASDQPEIEKPLTIQGEAIGYVSLREPQAYRGEAAEIIEAVTDRLSAHLENLRLSEQTERALAEVEALYEASTQVIQAKSINETLQALVYNSSFRRFDRVTLLFFDRPWTQERPEFMTPIALWERDNEHPAIAPGTYYTLEQFPVISLFSADQPTILTDIAADERADGNTRMLLVEELGMRSLVVFPLVVGGQWLGVITGQAYTTLSLNETDIRQLKSLTDQAATVIQTQRLFEQTQQTLKLTERLFEAGRRLNTAVDLQAAIAAVVESTPLQEINRAVLLLFEQNEAGEMEAGLVAANWHSGAGTLPTTIGTRYPWEIMGTLNFALSHEPVFFNDTYTDPRVDRFALEVFERQNIRALAVLPLWIGSRQLGVFLLEAEEIHPFTNNEIEPYIALAGQLAIVLDRQNLLEQTKAALAETSILYQTSQTLVVADSLDEILQAIASAEIVPGIIGVSLSTLEVNQLGQPEWSTLAANWSAGPSEATAAVPIGTRFYLPDFPMSQLWISTPESVMLIGDVYHDERVTPVLEAIFRQGNIAAVALLPLFVRGEWIGLITTVWSTPQIFTGRHQRLFNSLALQAAVTVNNQLLLERTQSALVEQERLTADLDNQRSTLQAVLQSIPAGVFVVQSPTGRPLLTNQQAQDLLGRGISPEATKEDLAEVYSAFRYGTDELYPPQEMPLVRGMSGELTTVDDMEIRRPDGRNILLQVFGGPIRDVSGQITASVAIFQDITEQRRTAQEREQLLAEVQAAYRQFVQREWNQFLGESHGGKWSVEHQQSEAILESNGKLKLLQDEVTQAGQIKTISATDEQAAQPALMAPISLRGQVIGTLSLQDIDPDRHWTAEEMALVETVSEQLAQTVENLRLFEETQKRATREQLTRAITDKMRALPDVDSIIETGLTELAKVLTASRTYVRLTMNPDDIAMREVDR
jgi:PAS domain S-box-containing protein